MPLCSLISHNSIVICSLGPNINPACAVVYETVGEDGAPVSKRAAVDLEVAGEEVIINDGQESSDSGQASDDTTAADNSSVTETASSLTGTSNLSDKPKQGESCNVLLNGLTCMISALMW